MAWWDKKAVQLQESVRGSERERDWISSDEHAKTAVVYTRHDMIMVVSYLSSLNRQLATIKIILTIVTAIAGAVAVKLILH